MEFLIYYLIIFVFLFLMLSVYLLISLIELRKEHQKIRLAIKQHKELHRQIFDTLELTASNAKEVKKLYEKTVLIHNEILEGLNENNENADIPR